MKSIKLITGFALTSALFYSCGTPEIVDTTSIESVTFNTSVTEVTTKAVITTEINATTKAEETPPPETSLENFIASMYFGYLYDFDLDGIPEAFYIDGGVYNELCIYKISSDGLVYIDKYPFNLVHPEWYTIPNITLYYDNSSDEYFYAIEHDIWEKTSNTAEVNKYVFKGNEIIEENIAYCEFNYSSKDIEFLKNTLFGKANTPIGTVKRDEVTHYYDGVEEYLSQFEKIKEITYEELTAVSIEDVINSGTLADYLP